ncbi:hypothetical protein P171DRAFT_427949 [Karstenula rhodostoma CBS 690.94]|uniref:Uncharacterized protein n=1 Tax=Karstenula rhodostoma CBS 690.94 TaxID=1392251 RepID=A0A9P4PV60_9PLEO|nr:hypothetical protein P171DRAFT_427949 [Karstenula rhodostoma CBS 690.94]
MGVAHLVIESPYSTRHWTVGDMRKLLYRRMGKLYARIFKGGVDFAVPGYTRLLARHGTHIRELFTVPLEPFREDEMMKHRKSSKTGRLTGDERIVQMYKDDDPNATHPQLKILLRENISIKGTTTIPKGLEHIPALKRIHAANASDLRAMGARWRSDRTPTHYTYASSWEVELLQHAYDMYTSDPDVGLPYLGSTDEESEIETDATDSDLESISETDDDESAPDATIYFGTIADWERVWKHKTSRRDDVKKVTFGPHFDIRRSV